MREPKFWSPYLIGNMMMKYKVMLVDDEPIALRGLEQLVNWDEIDCLLAGTAYSAVLALESIPEICPDIIVTDLVMPEMDGIEFISILNQRHPGIEVIILSGYGEFEYARQAIKNNVCEFLVKPATDEELKDAIVKVAAKIEQRRQREQSSEKQKELLDRSIPLLKNQYMLEIIKGNIDEQEARGKAAMIGFDFARNSWICLLHIDTKKNDDDIIAGLLLKEYCQEYFGLICRTSVIMDGELICIVLSDNESLIDDHGVFSYMEQLSDNIRIKYGLSTSIGVSPCFREIKDAPGAYSAAYGALMSRFFLGLGQVIHYSVAVESRESGMYPYEAADGIINRIRYQENLDARELSDELVDAFIKSAGYNIETIYQFCYQFCIRLREVLQSMDDGSLEQENYSLPEVLRKLRGKSSVDELKSYLAGIIAGEVQLIDSVRKRKAGSIIDKVKQYIGKNLSEDLTLNAVAAMVFMNPTYFCLFFKQSTGINYHDYVFAEKMKHARKLLIEDQMKIYEVSELVGYMNPRSFSDAFRRYWGMTPSNYLKSFYDSRQ